MFDIVLAVICGLALAGTAFMGVHLKLHPVREESKRWWIGDLF
jgi:hypothetical protein